MGGNTSRPVVTTSIWFCAPACQLKLFPGVLVAWIDANADTMQIKLFAFYRRENFVDSFRSPVLTAAAHRCTP